MDAKLKEIEARCERDAGMDWEQVRQNGGPPCFHTIKEGVLCGRAKQWFGHGKFGHEYMSLADLLRESAEREKKLVEALKLALEPLAVLVVSGACVDTPTEICEQLKRSVIKGHDAALALLALYPVEPPTAEKEE